MIIMEIKNRVNMKVKFPERCQMGMAYGKEKLARG